ncbi:MAG: transposase [Sciscionella sp.]
MHVTETCGTGAAHGQNPATSGGEDHDEDGDLAPLPHLIVNVQTTDATVPDNQMTAPIHARLAERDLVPAEHYVDSGYPSAELLVSSLASFGIALLTPMLADTSPQARAGTGFDRATFTIDFDAQQATCPQRNTSNSWNPLTQRGTDTIVITFAKAICGPCPVRAQCTTSASGRRQLTVHTQQVHQAQTTARATERTKDFQAKYALRAGVEPTIRQGVAVTGMRHARYRGLTKTRLEHTYSAVALNLIRLHAWWNGHPMDRTRTSHLARLELALAS